MPPKQKALERLALKEAEMLKKAEEEEERRQQTIWSIGADTKGAAKQAKKAAEETEKARKAKEKADLLAADEASAPSSKGVKKKKNVKGDDLDLLNQALAAAPKTKKQKEMERKKKEQEERKKKEAAAKAAADARKEAEKAEQEEAARRGITLGHSDSMMIKIENKLEEDSDEVAVTGLDEAVSLLSVGGGPAENLSRKALYRAYFDKQLPVFKEEQPGLTLSQYNERIFDSWRNSPENPTNRKAS